MNMTQPSGRHKQLLSNVRTGNNFGGQNCGLEAEPGQVLLVGTVRSKITLDKEGKGMCRVRNVFGSQER